MNALDPAKFKIDDNTEFVDVDLDEEEVYFEGERLTEARAQEVAAEVLAEVRKRNLRPGGKSLSGGTTMSPTIQVRVPESLKVALESEAEERHVGLSKLVRSILEAHVGRSEAS